MHMILLYHMSGLSVGDVALFCEKVMFCLFRLSSVFNSGSDSVSDLVFISSTVFLSSFCSALYCL